MKKKMLILFISSTILLSGCQKDPLSEQVSQEISQLENVTLDDEDTVTELENTYENMTDKQKNQVKNYTDLREARKKIEELKKIQNMAYPYHCDTDSSDRHIFHAEKTDCHHNGHHPDNFQFCSKRHGSFLHKAVQMFFVKTG